MNLIVRGKSMSVYSTEPKFYSSSIVGGIIPIALGVAQSIKLKGEPNKVWCFVGDMTFESTYIRRNGLEKYTCKKSKFNIV